MLCVRGGTLRSVLPAEQPGFGTSPPQFPLQPWPLPAPGAWHPLRRGAAMGVAGFANPMAPARGQVGVQEPAGLWERTVVR